MEAEEFKFHAAYTVDQVARILQFHPKTVRELCRTGRLAGRLERGGYRIPGWGIRDYLEGRITIQESGNVK